MTNVEVLISCGAKLDVRIDFGLAPADVLAWSALFLDYPTMLMFPINNKPLSIFLPLPDFIDEISQPSKEEVPSKGALALFRTSLSSAIARFAEFGHRVDPRLEQLLEGWDNVTPSSSRCHGRDKFFKLTEEELGFNSSGTRKLFPFHLMSLKIKKHQRCALGTSAL